MPRALAQPTVKIRVYRPNARNGTREKDLTVFTSARFTRTRNAVGDFEIVIPLVEPNKDLLEEINFDWHFEFWSDMEPAEFLFGGYVTRRRWTISDNGQAQLAVSGPSYLGWLAQRRLLGGTGSLAWAATLGGLETPSYKPPINEVMFHAANFNPNSLTPRTTMREHPRFQVPSAYPITHRTDQFSDPTLPSAWGIPRLTAAEITAFLSGTEVFENLVERVGDRVVTDPVSVWYGMPRISYDIIRYDGPPFTDFSGTWPTDSLYLVIRVPGLGVNRSVGNTLYTPVIFDVESGGVTSAEYIEDVSELKNFVWVLGVGEKASRYRASYQDGNSIADFGLVEDVLDAGQESNLNVIDQKGRDHLNERRLPRRTGKFTVSMQPGQIYGYDFLFDDVVTINWNRIGLVINEFVTSVTLNIGGQLGGIQDAEIVVGSEKLARESSLLGRYLSGLKRGLTNLRI